MSDTEDRIIELLTEIRDAVQLKNERDREQQLDTSYKQAQDFRFGMRHVKNNTGRPERVHSGRGFNDLNDKACGND